jgi:hypothetical protein
MSRDPVSSRLSSSRAFAPVEQRSPGPSNKTQFPSGIDNAAILRACSTAARALALCVNSINDSNSSSDTGVNA